MKLWASELLWTAILYLVEKLSKENVEYKVFLILMGISIVLNLQNLKQILILLIFLKEIFIDLHGILLKMMYAIIQEVQEKLLLRSMKQYKNRISFTTLVDLIIEQMNLCLLKLLRMIIKKLKINVWE